MREPLFSESGVIVREVQRPKEAPKLQVYAVHAVLDRHDAERLSEQLSEWLRSR